MLRRTLAADCARPSWGTNRLPASDNWCVWRTATCSRPAPTYHSHPTAQNRPSQRSSSHCQSSFWDPSAVHCVFQRFSLWIAPPSRCSRSQSLRASAYCQQASTVSVHCVWTAEWRCLEWTTTPVGCLRWGFVRRESTDRESRAVAGVVLTLFESQSRDEDIQCSTIERRALHRHHEWSCRRPSTPSPVVAAWWRDLKINVESCSFLSMQLSKLHLTHFYLPSSLHFRAFPRQTRRDRAAMSSVAPPPA